jgi:hypothetical protein
MTVLARASSNLTDRPTEATFEIAANVKQGSSQQWKFSKPLRGLHMAFNVQYLYDYITKLCQQQREVLQNHENDYDRSIGQGEARRRKYKRLKLGGGQAYDRCSD